MPTLPHVHSEMNGHADEDADDNSSYHSDELLNNGYMPLALDDDATTEGVSVDLPQISRPTLDQLQEEGFMAPDSDSLPEHATAPPPPTLFEFVDPQPDEHTTQTEAPKVRDFDLSAEQADQVRFAMNGFALPMPSSHPWMTALPDDAFLAAVKSITERPAADASRPPE